MATKDYYKILEVKPDASTEEIKKSYRRLAHQYHPDKNAGNKLLEAKFSEVLEAYKVLSDDLKRRTYNLQFNQKQETVNKKPTPPPNTATTVLQKSWELRKRAAQMDPDRLNKESLYHQLQHLLSAVNIAVLKRENDYKINYQVIENCLIVCRLLTYNSSLKITSLLLAIAGVDNKAYIKIYQFRKDQKMRTYWLNYKILFALLIALLLCLLIYAISE